MKLKSIRKFFKRFLYKIKNFSINDAYHDFVGFFECLHERIGRSWAFAKFGYMHYDFDGAFLYSIMSFKLKRIRHCLMTYSHGCNQREDMLALDEAIEICDRLFAEDYEDSYIKLHDQKWGEPEYYKSRGFSNKRINADTKEKRQQEQQEFVVIFDKALVDRNKDIDRFAEILKKHQATWWD